jgi:cyanobactin cluster PatC/TenC/TruC protein
MSKEKKTTAEPKIVQPVTKPEKKEIKQDLMMTGLSDYGFWAQQVKEERAARKEPDPAFRRGRIWA